MSQETKPSGDGWPRPTEVARRILENPDIHDDATVHDAAAQVVDQGASGSERDRALFLITLLEEVDPSLSRSS